MPDVVFFGGSVPAARVEQCKAAVHSADALLAVGTSLQVYSGFRFCRLAAELGKPIALVNQGITRADDLAELKLNSDCATLLSRVADEAGAS
jgi:NAD-dependent SIR2 family protein deacetylase